MDKEGTLSCGAFEIPSGLSLLSINVRSLMARIHDLRMLDLRNVGVLALQEVWAAIPELVQIDGFELAVMKTRPTCRGGGVAIYCRKDIRYEVRQNLVTNIDYEAVGVFVHVRGCKFYIENFYRRPQGNIYACLNAIEENCRDVGNCMIFAGDLNVDFLQPNNLVKQTLRSVGLMNLITLPTRITQDSSTSIDVILSSREFKSFRTDLNLADHFATGIILDGQQRQNTSKIQPTQKCLKVNAKNVATIKDELKSLTWDHLEALNAQDSFEDFYQKFRNVIANNQSNTLPKYKNKHVSFKQAWMNRETLSKRAELTKELNRKNRNFDLIKNLKTEYKKAIRQAKSAYFKKCFDQNDPKKTWQAINELLGKYKSSELHCPLLDQNGKLCQSEVEKANIFNERYANIGMQISNQIHHEDVKPIQKTEKAFKMPDIGPKVVLKCLKSLKSQNSFGPDGISNNVLKTLAEEICTPMSIFINKCYKEGYAPEEFKVARVKMLYKGGDKSSASNYRPISLINSCGKVLDKIFTKHFNSYMYENHLWSQFQNAHIKGRSTMSALAEIVTHIEEETSNGKYVIGISLDIKSAYSCVQYNLIFEKLKLYGVSGSELKFIESYIQNRRQFVELNGCKSSSLKIGAGVPQGSSLASYLYCLYVEGLPGSKQRDHILYGNLKKIARQ